MIFAVSDTVYQAIIAGCVTVVLAALAIVNTVVQALMARKTREAVNENRRVVSETAERAAERVEEVKTSLAKAGQKIDARADSLQAVTTATHELVNGTATRALRRVADLARWKADREPTPSNLQDALEAEQEVAAHAARQGVARASP